MPKPDVPFEPLPAVQAVLWSRHLHAVATLPAVLAVLWSCRWHAAAALLAVLAALEIRRRLASTSKMLICHGNDISVFIRYVF